MEKLQTTTFTELQTAKQSTVRFGLVLLYRKSEDILANSPPYLRTRKSPPPPINFRMAEQIFMKLGIYHGNWAHLYGVFHKILPPVSVSMFLGWG
jgi:hypothetical protein